MTEYTSLDKSEKLSRPGRTVYRTREVFKSHGRFLGTEVETIVTYLLGGPQVFQHDTDTRVFLSQHDAAAWRGALHEELDVERAQASKLVPA